LEDFNHNPISGQAVTFTVIDGGGNFNGSTSIEVLTGSDGIASATATLGTVAGDSNNVFQAIHSSAQGSPITFKASAQPGPAVELKKDSGDSQTGQVNRTLSQPFVVRVVDAFNNGIANYDVVFTVKSGEGSINGQQTLSVKTSETGYASARLKLGKKIGENVVEASANGLQNSPVTFTAQAIAGDPAILHKISGDQQQGDPGTRLPRPFVVSVTDSFNNVISGHDVVFTVKSGGGNIDGQTAVTRTTNSQGQASATLTLGPTEYVHEVEVTSEFNGQPLDPVTFTATTGPGDPFKLVYVSGDSQIGKINDRLPEPLRVQVVDEHDIPISNHDVTFYSFSPGAHFESNKKDITVKTDQNGIASVDAWIGSTIGDNLYDFEAHAKFNGVHLQNSPYTFHASGRITTARKIVYLSGDGLTDVVGKTLTDSLKVYVVDKDSLPVADQPVTFTVEQGDARLNGAKISDTVNSDHNGVAAISVTLGDRPGWTKIVATANDGRDPLENSGDVQFQVRAIIGPPDPVTSSIATNKDTLVAGTTDVAEITVTLKDYKLNPVSGKTVQLFTDKSQATVTPPSDTTNSNGQAIGTISCTLAGTLRVWAVVDGQVIPDDSLKIQIVPGPPFNIVRINNGQFAKKGEPLEKPVGYEIKDEFGNPIPDLLLKFEVLTGGGYIDGPDTVRTDTEGKATVRWVLGRDSATQELGAQIVNMPGIELEKITALGGIPDIKSLEIVHGDSLIGFVNQPLPDSFVVVVKDSQDYPIEGYYVNFTVIQGPGTGRLEPASAMTNKDGIAVSRFIAGAEQGYYEVQASIGAFHVIFHVIIEDEPRLYLENASDDLPGSLRPLQQVTLKVRGRDAFHRIVAGDSVKFSITRGDGSFLSDPVTVTDTQGLAQATWRLGTRAGTQEVQVLPVNKAGQAVVFTINVVNHAPVITLSPPDTFRIVEPGSPINWTVRAPDEDGDIVTLGVVDLPSGAFFDASTGRFDWTPTESDRGIHAFAFIATDQFGAADTARVLIRVGTNRSPVVNVISPTTVAPDTLVIHPDSTVQTFTISAQDPDSDSLVVTWYLDGVRINGDRNSDSIFSLKIVLINSKFSVGSVHTVYVDVSDSQENVGRTWIFVRKYPTSVELSSFQADVVDGHIRLNWQTASEVENLGFNVLRSQSRNGVYEIVNASMISPRSDGHYNYVGFRRDLTVIITTSMIR